MINMIFAILAKSNFNNIKSKMFGREPERSEVILANTTKGTFFVGIDGIKTGNGGIFLSSFDFDEDKYFIVFSDDIDFVFKVAPVTSKKGIVIFFKKLAGDVFT